MTDRDDRSPNEPGEQIPGEKSNSYALFRSWLITVDQNGKRLKLDEWSAREKQVAPTIRGMAARNRWHERAAEVDRRARGPAENKALDRIAEMRLRHVMAAQKMQRVAEMELDQIFEAKSSGARARVDAAKLLDTATRIERLAEGEPTDHSTVSDDLDLSLLTDEELAMLRALRDKARCR